MAASCRASEVVGLGVDLVELPRFSAFLSRSDQSLAEVFTGAERDLAAASACRDLYLAVRWAAKEAVLKALGTGWAAGVAWTDVEAVGPMLAPEVRLRGAAKGMAARVGACAARVSVSRGGACVIAVAVLVREGSRGLRTSTC